jgi:hypothetical protein
MFKVHIFMQEAVVLENPFPAKILAITFHSIHPERVSPMKRLLVILAMLLIVLPVSACAAPASSPAEEQQVTAVVEGFGQKLQMVSLLAPSAANDIRAQYTDYVSPNLLDQWASNPSQAPGRITSSPWPDRIEINSMTKKSASEYEVTDNIIEVTSVEVNTGGAAATIPVQISVQKSQQGNWLIADFQQGQSN